MNMKKVIYDTDPGIDDAMALLYLNACENLNLIGITTTCGNASIDQCTTNALFLTELFSIEAPVYRGADASLNGEIPGSYPVFVHGDNGLGNIDYIKHKRTTEKLDAADYLIQAVKNAPGEISILAVGRLTNLALALTREPSIAGDIKEVIMMGGAYLCEGNISAFAEANVFGDPEAAALVFSEIPGVTMVGLDVTLPTIMTPEYLNALCENSGAAGRFIRDISPVYADYYKQSQGWNGFPVHDSSAIAFADIRQVFTTLTGRLDCTVHGEERGRTLFEENPNGTQKVCVSVDSNRLLQRYADVMARFYG
jgi:purine nucleosidase